MHNPAPLLPAPLDIAVEKPVRTRLQRKPHLLALEQRFMYDGAAVSSATHAVGEAALLAQIAAVPAAVEVRAATPSLTEGKNEVVIVDTSLSNYQALEAGIPVGMGIVEINGTQNGLAQIAQWATTQSGIDAIYILSHGNEAQLQLGATTLTDSSLANPVVQTELTELGHALKSGGDLLIYGCNVAEGSNGSHVINELATDTGAIVAANTEATGAAALGGDWTLNYSTGAITATALNLSTYQGLLSATTFEFGTGDGGTVTGSGTTTVTETIGSNELTVTGATEPIDVDTVANIVDLPLNDVSQSANVAETGDGALYYETQVTFGMGGSQTFNMNSIIVIDTGQGGGAVTLTTSKGSESFSINAANDTVIDLATATHASYFQNVTSVALTSPGNITSGTANGQFVFAFDDISVTPTTAVPTTTVTSAALSADTGSSSTDFITNSAAQTISGTLSANLASGESVQVSYDGGSTWSNASSYTVGSSTWSTTTTLSGSNTFEARVTNSGGSSTAYTHSYELDTTTPATPTVTSLSSASTTPTISGTDTATGDTLTVSVGGATYAVTPSAGAWSLNLTTATPVSGSLSLSHGSTYTVTATVTDIAGNTASDTSSQQLAVIAVPTVSTLSTASTTPTITGTDTDTDSSDILAISVGGATYDVTPSAGTWSLNLATATPVSGSLSLSAGNSYTVTATVTDSESHTVSSTSTNQLTITTGAVPTTTVATAALSADTGSSSTDFITNTAAQTISGTLSANLAAGESVQVSYNGGTTWSNATSYTVGSSSWSTTTTLSGSNTFEARVTNSNGSSTAYTHSYELDTTTPATPTVTALSSASTNPTISGADTATGDTLTVSVGGATYAVTPSAGAWSLNLATATPTSGSLSLSAGSSYTVTATVTDIAGNTASSSSSQQLAIIAVPTVATLSTASTTPTITGTDTDTDSSDTLSITVGGATYSVTPSSGAWSLDLSTATPVSGSLSLSAGNSYTVTATITDSESHTVSSTSTNQLTITNGAGAPTTTVASAALSNDSGSSSTDFITNVANQTISGTLSANLAAGESVQVSYDGGTTWSNATSYTVGSNAWSTTTTLAGSNIFEARVTNGSGSSTAYTHSYDLDTSTPVAPTVSVLSSASTTPTIGGTDSAGSDILTVSVGGATYNVVPVSGAWSLNLATATPTSGSLNLSAGHTYTVVATVTDIAGNASVATNQLTITESAPTTMVTTAALSADTGSSNSDFITNVAAQTISGTLSANLAAGESVQVSYDGGATWSNATNYTVGFNAWSTTTTLAGSNTFEARVTNSVGNSTAYTHSYELDTTTPATPTVSVPGNASTTPIISGTDTATGDTLTINLGGATYNVTPVNGTWNLDLATATPTSGSLNLVAGNTYTVTATVTDVAGNSATSVNQLTITGSAPSTTVSTAALSSDTGSSSTDFITNVAAQTISGTLSANLAAGESVQVSYDGGTTWSNATSYAVGSNTWSAITTLSGSNTFEARVTNSSGSSTAYTHSYELDTTAPAAPTVSVLNSPSTAPLITGTDTATGDTLTVSVGGATYSVTPVDNAWSLNLATATPTSGALSLSPGHSYTVVATTTDVAGNSASNTSSNQLTIAVVAFPKQPLSGTEQTDTSLALPNATPTIAVGAPTLSFLPLESVVATPQVMTVTAETTLAAVLPNIVSDAGNFLTPPASRGSYQAMVLPGSGDALLVNVPLNDATVTSGSNLSFQIPSDAFGDTNPNAVISLFATQANGAALPSWLHFNATSGKFTGQAPVGMHGEVDVRVIARDNQGHEAVQVLKIMVGDQHGSKQPQAHVDDRHDKHDPVSPPILGRSSLSQQLQASRSNGTDRLQAFAHSLKAASGRT